MQTQTMPNPTKSAQARQDRSASTQQAWRDLLDKSLRVNWRIDDLIGGPNQLDFTRPFLPETYAQTRELGFLSEGERLTLNHIRAHGYLAMFGLVEEFILPYIADHARPESAADDYRVRALLQFAGEEAKHIHLFKRFREAFCEGFDTTCEFIGPADEISRAVLNHDELAVGIAIIGIEWMSQGHYVESVKDDQALDPVFKSLLKHHWMEEAQHAKIDALLLAPIAQSCSPAAIEKAIDEYFEIGMFLDEGLKQQAAFDLDALQRAIGRALSPDEREEVLSKQHQALRWTFLGTAMTNRHFLGFLETLGATARRRVKAAAAAFSLA